MDPGPPLEALLDAARRGEADAGDRLMRAVLPELRAYVRLRAGAHLLARERPSDLVQGICVQLVRDVGRVRYEGAAAFRAWVLRAAENQLRGRARYWDADRRARDREVGRLEEREADELLRGYRSFCTPSANLRSVEAVERIERCFHGLPEAYRDVILRARVLGLSTREIALELGRSEGAVRTLLYRGLAAFSAALEADER